jgi:hypothetical protein
MHGGASAMVQMLAAVKEETCSVGIGGWVASAVLGHQPQHGPISQGPTLATS